MASMSSSSLVLPCLAFRRTADRSTALYSVPQKKPLTGANIDDVDEVLANKTILPTAHGYVLVHDPASLSTFLYSPQSRRKIDLPPLDMKLDEEEDEDLLLDCNCLLSGDPTDPSCVVLLVELYDPFIWYHRIGDDDDQKQWHMYEYDIGSQQYDPDDSTLLEKTVITPIAACRGKFCFNAMPSEDGETGVIDFSSPDAGPTFGSIAVGSDEDVTHSAVFLVESQGELYMVQLLFDAIDIHKVTGASVHVMDFEGSRWRRVGDLGGRAFVLSLQNFGASCEAGGETGLRGDCVYMAYPVAKELLVFDVKDGSMKSVKLDEAPASKKAFWVLPSR